MFCIHQNNYDCTAPPRKRGEREGKREGGREGVREGGREGGRGRGGEGGREREIYFSLLLIT